MAGGWIRSVVLDPDVEVEHDAYPFTVPAIGALRVPLALDPGVTFLVGENGSGKSTLVEAIAVAAGFNPEGGDRHLTFETRGSTSTLHDHLRVVREPRRPATGYFLRAESFFNVATEVERLGPSVEAGYGGRALHEQSHGEAFLALALHRFGPDGFYVLDEPEAALSPQGCLSLLRRIHELVGEGCQFVIATHSPLLVAYPQATLYELGPAGIERVDYDDAELTGMYRSFLAAPDRFLRHLLA